MAADRGSRSDVSALALGSTLDSSQQRVAVDGGMPSHYLEPLEPRRPSGGFPQQSIPYSASLDMAHQRPYCNGPTAPLTTQQLPAPQPGNLSHDLAQVDNASFLQGHLIPQNAQNHQYPNISTNSVPRGNVGGGNPSRQNLATTDTSTTSCAATYEYKFKLPHLMDTKSVPFPQHLDLPKSGDRTIGVSLISFPTPSGRV
jgi:hypothetical protein